MNTIEIVFVPDGQGGYVAKTGNYKDDAVSESTAYESSICATNCPVQAIDPVSFRADSKKCIGCMRCVKQCPHDEGRVNAVMPFYCRSENDRGISGAFSVKIAERALFAPRRVLFKRSFPLMLAIKKFFRKKYLAIA